MSHPSLGAVWADIQKNVLFDLAIDYIDEHQATINATLPSTGQLLKLLIHVSLTDNSPPKVVPMSYLPGPEFCLISALHCEVKKKYSSSFSFGIVLNAALCHLIDIDQSLLLPKQSSLGGQFALVSDPLQNVAVENQIAELYCECQHVIAPRPSNAQKLSKSIEQAIDYACDDKGLKLNPSGKPKADIRRAPTGTGYSNGYERREYNAVGKTQRLIEHLSQRMQVLTAYYVQQHLFDGSLEWLLTSPLFEILCAVLREFSREEIVRQQHYVGRIVSIVSRLEMLHSRLWRTSKTSGSHDQASRSCEIRNSLHFVYTLVHNVVKEDLFEGEQAWLNHLQQFSKGYAEAAASLPASVSPSPKHGAAIKDEKLADLSERVVYIDGLESQHTFLQYTAAHQRVPRSWLKELKTIAENLPSSITLFVAEDVPQLCVAALCIQENNDAPYFGGTFVFDLYIPDTYPAEPPMVNLCTTGGGSVRFNPNLYECGKVCLSLLGTWSGEPWNPKKSNITQVLKSILFLIFVEEPFYNEPGYTRPANLPSGSMTHDSLNYNLRVMKSSLEYAILDHFRTPLSSQGHCSQASKGRDTVTAYIRRSYQQNWHDTLRLPLIKLHQRYATILASGAAMESIMKKVAEIDRTIPTSDSASLIDSATRRPAHRAPEGFPAEIPLTAYVGLKEMASEHHETEEAAGYAEDVYHDEYNDAYHDVNNDVYHDVYDYEAVREGNDYEEHGIYENGGAYDAVDDLAYNEYGALENEEEEYYYEDDDEENEVEEEEGANDDEDVRDEEENVEEEEDDDDEKEDDDDDDDEEEESPEENAVFQGNEPADGNHQYDIKVDRNTEGHYLNWKEWQRLLYESSSVMISERQLWAMAQANVPLEDVLVHYFENLDEMMALG